MPARWALVKEPADLRELIVAADPAGAARREFIVKVNWFSPHPGNFTGPAALDLLLAALPDRVVVIESHSSGRTSGGRWVGAGRAVGPARDYLRREEQAFLERTGLAKVMERHGARYVNVTEEVWAGRTVDPEVVREAVRAGKGLGKRAAEGKARIGRRELFGQVPSVLYEMSPKALFLNFARLKLSGPESGAGYSLSLKNMFGLIPEPSRTKYHKNLPRSILDANRIYLALFDVLYLCEAIENTIVYRDGGAYHAPWGDYDLDAGHPGLVVAGQNGLEVDVVAAALRGVDISGRDLYREASRFFGVPSPETVAAARAFSAERGLGLAP